MHSDGIWAAMATHCAHCLGLPPTLHECIVYTGQDWCMRNHLAAALQIQETAKDDLNGTIMCIGHNKGWEEAASAFAQRPVHLETANAALLQQSADSWQQALDGDEPWELVGLVTASDGLQPAPEAPAQASDSSSDAPTNSFPPPAAA